MTEITIAGRKIPLVFNMDSWCELEKDVCVLSKINIVLGQQKVDGFTSEALGQMISMLRVLGNQGLELEGKDRDLTDKWLRKNLKPRQALDIKMAIINEIDSGMEMETKEKDPSEPRDLVLEEINQKKTASE